LISKNSSRESQNHFRDQLKLDSVVGPWSQYGFALEVGEGLLLAGETREGRAGGQCRGRRADVIRIDRYAEVLAVDSAQAFVSRACRSICGCHRRYIRRLS
jgi:hypothetical protein